MFLRLHSCPAFLQRFWHMGKSFASIYPMNYFVSLFLATALAQPSLRYNSTFATTTVLNVLADHGLNVEIRKVRTADGFILTNYVVFAEAPKGVLFFQHGLMDNAAGFSIHQPTETNLFVRAVRAGLTVVIGNNRGNGISMEHLFFNHDSDAFWNFTFDDYAIFDLPAQLRHAAALSPNGKVHYVGHSQGTTQFFTGITHAPAIADYLSGASLLAPVFTWSHITVWWMRALGSLPVWVLFRAFGIRSFEPPTALRSMFPAVCAASPRICDELLFDSMGPSNSTHPAVVPLLSHLLPAPTSVHNMIHWRQGLHSGVAEYYDFGSIEANQAAYGQPFPPPVDLGHFPGAPRSSRPALPRLRLHFGDLDKLAHVTDAADLKHRMKVLGIPHNVTTVPHYAHQDYMWSTSAHTLVYDVVIADALLM